jgi:hypothetical protein
MDERALCVRLQSMRPMAATPKENVQKKSARWRSSPTLLHIQGFIS